MHTWPASSREVNSGSDNMLLRGGGCPSRVAYREVATSVGQHKGCALLSGKKPTKKRSCKPATKIVRDQGQQKGLGSLN